VKRDLKDWSITKELAIDMRVEVSNSCDRTLIFGSSSFIVFLYQFFSFYSHIFAYLLPFISPFLFTFVFVSVFFWLPWVSSLAYPNLLETKKNERVSKPAMHQQSSCDEPQCH
jgi:hypothetical protein